MIYEIAKITVKPGLEAEFEGGVLQAQPLFKRAKGCLGMELQRVVERPLDYRLVIRWATLEDHTVHFRGSEDFQAWRRLVGTCFAAPPDVEHASIVVGGF